MMAVPKFYEFFSSFLCAVSDGEIHKSKEDLSAEDMAEQVPSQRQATYD